MTPSTKLPRKDVSNDKILIGLEDAVQHALQQIQRGHYQLTQIEENHDTIIIRRATAAFLAKNEKLQRIATELIDNIQTLRTAGAEDSALIEQYLIEVELLHDLHFAVARTYVGFIHRYFETRIVRLCPMAA